MGELVSQPEPWMRGTNAALDPLRRGVIHALEQAEEDGRDEVCVIGGASLFELALKRAKRIYLTEVAAEVEGDVVLAGFDESLWREVRGENYPAGDDDDHTFRFRVLERK